MGQKINPILIRIGIPGERKKTYKNKITYKTSDKFDREDFHKIEGDKRNYAKNLDKVIFIEKYLTEYFMKSGIYINDIRIHKKVSSYIIYIDLFKRKTKKRKILWTARKLNWRNHTRRDLDFIKDFFETSLTDGYSILWKVRFLSNFDKESKMDQNSKSLKGREWLLDGDQIFTHIRKEPGARLLAEYMREELLHVKRHSIFIRYVFNNMDKICGVPDSNLIGCLISLKGRLEGSDRSKRTRFRKGSIPLHTLKACIDYHSTEIVNKYGLTSIKIWILYK